MKNIYDSYFNEDRVNIKNIPEFKDTGIEDLLESLDYQFHGLSETESLQLEMDLLEEFKTIAE